MLIVGLAWQLGVVVILMGALLWVGWRYLHRCPLPVTWPRVMSYTVGITALSELLSTGSYLLDDTVPVHLEVLLPAFVVGCLLARPPGSDPHRDDTVEGTQMGPEPPGEQRVATLVAAVFMLLVGLSLPPLAGETTSAAAGIVSAAQPPLPWEIMVGHVVALTMLANLGKMVPAFCYRQEAHGRERLAVAMGMWPRGEVGAGVLVVSLGYGLGGPMITAAMLSLALNLVLTGMFILLVKWLVAGKSTQASVDLVPGTNPRYPLLTMSQAPLARGAGGGDTGGTPATLHMNGFDHGAAYTVHIRRDDSRLYQAHGRDAPACCGPGGGE